MKEYILLKKFLISGCFRSGTTLLRLCLDSHSQIICYDEGISRYQIENSLISRNEINGYKVPFLSLKAHTFKEIFGNDVKTIWMQRNPLSVASSMVLMRGSEPRFDDYWGFERWVKNELYSQKELHDKLFEKIHEANRLEGRSRKVAFSSICWNACCKSLDANNNENFLCIKYDNFAREPENILRSICKFIGVDYEDNLLNHHKFSHEEVFDGIATGGTKAARAIDCLSIDKFKYVLTDEEKTICLKFAY